MRYGRSSPPPLGTGNGLTHGVHPKNTTPAGFWKGWSGPQAMAPPIRRRPSKPSNSFWNPKRAGGMA